MTKFKDLTDKILKDTINLIDDDIAIKLIGFDIIEGMLFILDFLDDKTFLVTNELEDQGILDPFKDLEVKDLKRLVYRILLIKNEK